MPTFSSSRAFLERWSNSRMFRALARVHTDDRFAALGHNFLLSLVIEARMSHFPRPTVLCLSSYFKGNRFLRRCKREGCHVILVTVDERRHSEWERECVDEFFVMPTLADRRAVINGLAYLMRTRSV